VDIADRFATAFNKGDFAGIRELLDESVVAWVTTDRGDQAKLIGADTYVASLRAMLTSAPTEYQVSLTQKPVVVSDESLLIMIEVRAHRGGRSLHNYSAQLFTLSHGRISEIRMTDAKPAESAAFWA
jgi:ketosteroid isomerase-like protein